MSKVLTFSREFPSYHPRRGEKTFFVEKIWCSMLDQGKLDVQNLLDEYDAAFPSEEFPLPVAVGTKVDKPKHHTIRAGQRFKAGEYFSPRVWAGKPYRSKQIQFHADIEIKKTWQFTIYKDLAFSIDQQIFLDGEYMPADLVGICAGNDGLSFMDFMHWFQWPKLKPFEGQIICWNSEIEYDCDL